MLGATEENLEPVPAYASALPFLATIALLLVNLAAGRLMSSLLRTHITNVIQDSSTTVIGGTNDKTFKDHLPEDLTAEELQKRFEWSLDVVQASTAVVAPAAGVAFLNLTITAENSALILVAVVSLTLILLFGTLKAGPRKYATYMFPRGRSWGLSLVTWVGILLNALAAVAAYVFAEPVFSPA